MLVGKILNTLEFDDNPILDDEVRHVRADPMAFV